MRQFVFGEKSFALVKIKEIQIEASPHPLNRAISLRLRALAKTMSSAALGESRFLVALGEATSLGVFGRAVSLLNPMP